MSVNFKSFLIGGAMPCVRKWTQVQCSISLVIAARHRSYLPTPRVHSRNLQGQPADPCQQQRRASQGRGIKAVFRASVVGLGEGGRGQRRAYEGRGIKATFRASVGGGGGGGRGAQSLYNPNVPKEKRKAQSLYM